MLRMAVLGHERSFKQTILADKSTCSVKIIACIEDSAVIKNILAHLDDNPTPLRVSCIVLACGTSWDCPCWLQKPPVRQRRLQALP